MEAPEGWGAEVPAVALLPAEIGFQWVHHLPRLLTEQARALGERFRVPLPGYGPVLVLSHPEDLGVVFTSPDPGFVPREGRGVFSFLSTGSLLNQRGAAHRASRRRLLSALGAERLETARRAALRAAQEALHGARSGGRLDLTAYAESISTAAAAHLLFGRPAPGIARIVEAVLGAASPVLVTQTAAAARLQPILAEAHAEMAAEIRRGPGPEPCVLGALLEDAEAPPDPDELLTLAAAAQETTAVSLCWLAAEVFGPGPEAAGAREALLDTGGALLGAAVRESLRLHPPIAVIPAVHERPLALPGLTVPPGALVAPSPWLAHRHAGRWPEPERFLPARHLERSPAPWTWIPFGGGPRRCVGEAVALAVLEIGLDALLRGPRLAPLPRRPATSRRFLALAPAGRLLLTVVP